MSAFVVVYERLHTPVDIGVFNKIMERLSHRGPDGKDSFFSGNVVMGHWHFWTTPEEVGEHQPLELNASPFKIVFDGRLDNRSELFVKLGIDSVDKVSFSDANLALHAYARWGKDCVKYFIGEFAFAIFDEKQDELFCARDPLGDRTLFYGLFGTRFVVASEPWPIIGAQPAKLKLDESAIAHYFALKTPEDGRTFFKDVYELLPAHTLTVNETRKQLECYWLPDPSMQVRYGTDDEYAEHFLALLDESVRCRMRSTTPVGVQMSGGLDSTSVACLAARALPSGSLTTISYIFDEFVDCDERHYINAVKDYAKINSIQFIGDGFWPLNEWQAWPSSPNGPEILPYRLLIQAVQLRAQQEGLRVLFTGALADQLYQGGRTYFLADLVADGRMQDAIGELKMLFHRVGLCQMLQAGYLQQALIKLSYLRKILHKRYSQPEYPPWLTSASVDFLSNWETDRFDPVFDRHASVSALGLQASQIITNEIPFASANTIEMRHPYRDRRLVEFVLALPAYQLFYRGQTKYILRNAMQGILPEIVRTRTQPTSLFSLYSKGAKSGQRIFDSYYQKNNSWWRIFVRDEQILKLWQDNLSPVSISKSIGPWLFISFEKWIGSIPKPLNEVL